MWAVVHDRLYHQKRPLWSEFQVRKWEEFQQTQRLRSNMAASLFPTFYQPLGPFSLSLEKVLLMPQSYKRVTEFFYAVVG